MDKIKEKILDFLCDDVHIYAAAWITSVLSIIAFIIAIISAAK